MVFAVSAGAVFDFVMLMVFVVVVAAIYKDVSSVIPLAHSFL